MFLFFREREENLSLWLKKLQWVFGRAAEDTNRSRFERKKEKGKTEEKEEKRQN